MLYIVYENCLMNFAPSDQGLHPVCSGFDNKGEYGVARYLVSSV